MELVDYLDISYAPSAPPNSLQTFDAYIPKHLLEEKRDFVLLCFIHGGAWRSGDKSDHSALTRNLAVSTGYPVAVPNYRLTPKEPTAERHLHHPAHAEDTLRFLEFVLTWHRENGGHLPQKPSKVLLIGHSCSAHMLCTIFLRMPALGGSESVCISPSNELIGSTVAIVMSEGIYDIDLLLSSFPGYRTWFIENTFGRDDSFKHVSALKATVDPRGRHIHWLIIHSKADTLVDKCQSQEIYKFLKEKKCLVSVSFDELDEEHDAILDCPKYMEIIRCNIQDVVDR